MMRGVFVADGARGGRERSGRHVRLESGAARRSQRVVRVEVGRRRRALVRMRGRQQVRR